MIAVLHVVPAEPGHGIEPEPEVPGLAYHDAAGALAAPDGAGLVVLPEPEDDGGLLARVLVGVHELLVGVLLDGLPLGAAEAAGPLAQGVGHFAALDEDVGLALDVPVGGVAEADAGVLHYLGDDGPVPPVAGVGVRVPPGVGGAVAVHGGVAHVLLEQPGELVVLKERLELGVDDVGGAPESPVARAGGQGRALELELVAGDGGHGEERHALEEVELRRGQAVGFHALPLLADEEVLVHADGVVELDAVVVGEHFLILAPDRICGKFLRLHAHTSSPGLRRMSASP